MKITRCFIILVVLLNFLKVNGQEKGYIILKKQETLSKVEGIIYRIEGNKIQQLRFQKNKKSPIELLTPDDIIEFGFDEGNKWIVTELNNTKQFLEIIQEGKLNLLGTPADETGRRFYIQRDSFMELIHKHKKDNSFVTQLQTYTDDGCDLLRHSASNITYKVKSLNFFIENYNKSKCIPMPFYAYGIGIGANSSKLNVSEKNVASLIEGGTTAEAYNFAFIMYADIPLWRLNNFFLAHELTYGVIKYESMDKLKGNNLIFKLDLSYLQYSFSPKYTLPFERFRPYIKAGPTIRLILNEENKIGSKNGSFGGSQDIYLSNALLGINASTGLEVYYKSNKCFSLELQYKKLLGNEGYQIRDISYLFKMNF